MNSSIEKLNQEFKTVELKVNDVKTMYAPNMATQF